eukprot:COSAG06_NODE_63034_length_263_cov_0.884146_1_plen_25_part_10
MAFLVRQPADNRYIILYGDEDAERR